MVCISSSATCILFLVSHTVAEPTLSLMTDLALAELADIA
jgi:hypothetical protein